MRVIVTGGAGFIGSAVCRDLAGIKGHEVLNIDKLTYAADLRSLDAVSSLKNYNFAKQDICNKPAISKLFADFRPDAVLHLAAESHVDRSIEGPDDFIRTNVVGTFCLLEVARDYVAGLPVSKKDKFRFHHVSSDEVYGSLGDTGKFTEQTPYAPRSPYSASKASSDHLVSAWHHTYGLPVIISNCSNNYGPYQFPEKLIPLTILNLLQGRKVPIYGEGLNTRDWLHVEDHAEALSVILASGRVGEKYNVGGSAELTNIDVVRQIFDTLRNLRPEVVPSNFDDVVDYVSDRPGHDWRYAIDPRKTQTELGWMPKHSFTVGIRQTVQWYLDNRAWWQPILENKYAGQRLGRMTGAGNG
ncbi:MULTISPECIES: dTDP-glucose 4,6-dehydratase [unclassified Thalassospira]|uniref:dTDP-glucose 4,6-dehydratase n=1 Tax=unclassified Thalassospira TaxID=2648997 RepID=UPI0007A62755|nr:MULTISPECIES: dTDP-glucose 4,6-dehydratase [unclassified Thalassospira]KZC99981.1 dTDP-glucose 4,6-dehydratase [Thalassospira sp. MCCC 1A02898]ONH85965.1 dTDP-glucose 4,6-dehydratase [Thalassospira sp. MCCC 1A02803]